MAIEESVSAPAADSQVPLRSQPIAVVLDLFLEWVQQNLKSYDWYRRFLELFAQDYGELDVVDLRPIQVTNWMAKRKWGPTTRNKVIGTLKQAFNWAVDQGIIADNPIRKLKKPTPKRRKRILTAEERTQILASIRDQPFRDFVTAYKRS
jgi:site-specific recombinase XerD